MAHLSYEERVEIHSMRRLGSSLVEIGRHLGRHASTIGRELKRNISARGIYLPSTADNLANKRRRIPRLAASLNSILNCSPSWRKSLRYAGLLNRSVAGSRKRTMSIRLALKRFIVFFLNFPLTMYFVKQCVDAASVIDVKNRALSNPGFEIASPFMIGRNWSRSVSVLGTGSSISSDAIGAVAISLRLLIEWPGIRLCERLPGNVVRWSWRGF